MALSKEFANLREPTRRWALLWALPANLFGHPLGYLDGSPSMGGDAYLAVWPQASGKERPAVPAAARVMLAADIAATHGADFAARVYRAYADTAPPVEAGPPPEMVVWTWAVSFALIRDWGEVLTRIAEIPRRSWPKALASDWRAYTIDMVRAIEKPRAVNFGRPQWCILPGESGSDESGLDESGPAEPDRHGCIEDERFSVQETASVFENALTYASIAAASHHSNKFDRAYGTDEMEEGCRAMAVSALMLAMSHPAGVKYFPNSGNYLRSNVALAMMLLIGRRISEKSPPNIYHTLCESAWQLSAFRQIGCETPQIDDRSGSFTTELDCKHIMTTYRYVIQGVSTYEQARVAALANNNAFAKVYVGGHVPQFIRWTSPLVEILNQIIQDVSRDSSNPFLAFLTPKYVPEAVEALPASDVAAIYAIGTVLALVGATHEEFMRLRQQADHTAATGTEGEKGAAEWRAQVDAAVKEAVNAERAKWDAKGISTRFAQLKADQGAKLERIRTEHANILRNARADVDARIRAAVAAAVAEAESGHRRALEDATVTAASDARKSAKASVTAKLERKHAAELRAAAEARAEAVAQAEREAEARQAAAVKAAVAEAGAAAKRRAELGREHDAQTIDRLGAENAALRRRNALLLREQRVAEAVLGAAGRPAGAWATRAAPENTPPENTPPDSAWPPLQ